MVELKEGGTYDVTFCRNGDDWSMFRLKEEKGMKQIAVFGNHIPLAEGDLVNVERINRVRVSARQDRSGKWFDTVTVNVAMKKVDGIDTGFRTINETDSDLPF